MATEIPLKVEKCPQDRLSFLNCAVIYEYESNKALKNAYVM